MSTTTIFPIPGYPTIYLTEDRTQVTIRPMVPEDKDDLLDFFRRIPQEDRFDLKEPEFGLSLHHGRQSRLWTPQVQRWLLGLVRVGDQRAHDVDHKSRQTAVA